VARIQKLRKRNQKLNTYTQTKYKFFHIIKLL
jgi:hypothetical protein